jgi:hypothetical protein
MVEQLKLKILTTNYQLELPGFGKIKMLEKIFVRPKKNDFVQKFGRNLEGENL